MSGYNEHMTTDKNFPGNEEENPVPLWFSEAIQEIPDVESPDQLSILLDRQAAFDRNLEQLQARFSRLMEMYLAVYNKSVDGGLPEVVAVNLVFVHYQEVLKKGLLF